LKIFLKFNCLKSKFNHSFVPRREGIAPFRLDGYAGLRFDVIFWSRRCLHRLTSSVPSYRSQIVRTLRHETRQRQKTSGLHEDIWRTEYSGSRFCNRKRFWVKEWNFSSSVIT